jgi:hypothetical protein
MNEGLFGVQGSEILNVLQPFTGMVFIIACADIYHKFFSIIA